MKKMIKYFTDVDSMGNKRFIGLSAVEYKIIFTLIVFGLFLLVAKNAFSGESAYDIGEIHIGSHGTSDGRSIGRSASVVSNVDERGPVSVSDVLQDMRGVTVKRIDGQSGLTTVRIRGTRSVDTQLMYDGFELRDPSDPQGSSNPYFGDLLSSGISEVEVLRGASSSLYGSRAVGGAINLVPRTEYGGRIWAEYGTFNTFNEGVDYGFKMGPNASQFLSFAQTNSDGFDPHDEYKQSKFSGKTEINISEDHHLDLDYLYSNVDAKLNSAPFVKSGVLHTDADDENDKREQTLAHAGARFHGDLSDIVSYSMRAAATDSVRRYAFLPNSDGTGFFSDGDYEGRDFLFNPSISVKGGEHVVSTVGYKFDKEYYIQRTFLDGVGKSNLEDQKTAYHNDVYVEELLTFGDTSVSLAARENTSEFSKSRATWDAAVSQKLPTDAILRGHYGTSFREPSLFETQGSFLSAFGRTAVGNPLLSPERGASWDFGIEQPIGPFTLGSTYFRSDVLNKIDLIFPSYKNLEGMDHTAGVESFAKWRATENMTAKVSHTYTTGNRLYDVPPTQVSGSLTADFGPLHATTDATYYGDRKIRAFDNDTFLIDTLSEESNIAIGAKVSYDVTKNTTIYLRAENLTNEKNTIGGYRTPGARVYGGAVVRF